MDTLTNDLWRIAAVFLLVFANGFFVAAEFSLVSVRRSRVAELVTLGRMNAAALRSAIDRLDAYLAATQLGVTISSLALGWIGEPALAHVFEPLLAPLASWAVPTAHAISVAIAFAVITALHIVLGELAPKSLAIQRSERTALLIVRPLAVFLFVFRPVILALNGLGNGVLRLFGLRQGQGAETLHSPDEIKLLVAETRRAGLLQSMQQEVVERTFNLDVRRVRDIMTARPDVDWIDVDDEPAEIRRGIRACRHELVLVCRGSIDEVLGIVDKRDLLDQLLDGAKLDPLAALLKPLVLHEATPVLKVVEAFRTRPVSLALVMDEYGTLVGILTRTDLLETIAGELGEENHDPDIVARDDGSFLLDGGASIPDVFDRLDIRRYPEARDFSTMAGLALQEFGRFPSVGDAFDWDGWRFEVVDMDGHRIDELLATKVPVPNDEDADEDSG